MKPRWHEIKLTVAGNVRVDAFLKPDGKRIIVWHDTMYYTLTPTQLADEQQKKTLVIGEALSLKAHLVKETDWVEFQKTPHRMGLRITDNESVSVVPLSEKKRV